MREFQNLGEFMAFCDGCPVCHAKLKTLIEIGPIDSVYNPKVIKTDHALQLNFSCLDDNRFQYEAIFHISLTDHSFQYETSAKDSGTRKELREVLNKFYFYFNVECENCESYFNSSDVEIDFVNNRFSPIKMERGNYYIDRYAIFYEDMYPNQLKIYQDHNIENKTLKSTIPMIDIDFSDTPSLINKIKLLTTFS